MKALDMSFDVQTNEDGKSTKRNLKDDLDV